MVVFSDNVLNNSRIFFNVEANEFMDDGFEVDYDSIIFVHKDVASTLETNWTGLTDGVIKLNGIDKMGADDTIKTEEDDKIYMTIWAENIKGDIAGWLTEKGYADTNDVFNNEKQDGDIEALIAQYDKSYNQILQ